MNAVSMSEVWANVARFFTVDFHWTVIIEAILIFAMMFFVFKVLYENSAKRLIIVYVAVIILMGVVTLFSASEHAALLFLIVLLLLSMFFLLLFSVEIKRSIWRLGKAGTPTVNHKATPDKKLNMRTEACISGIVKAIQNLSKSDTGALIVLSNGNLPREILESGVMLEAQISSQLIEGIFIPKAPLHDGAMIIYGDKVQAAGCFLPLTQKDYPKEFGTRHRAGIGVTEAADVMTVIVSEETGIVSVVKRGVITRYVDSDGLRKFLREYYWKEFTAEGKKE